MLGINQAGLSPAVHGGITEVPERKPKSPLNVDRDVSRRPTESNTRLTFCVILVNPTVLLLRAKVTSTSTPTRLRHRKKVTFGVEL